MRGDESRDSEDDEDDELHCVIGGEGEGGSRSSVGSSFHRHIQNRIERAYDVIKQGEMKSGKTTSGLNHKTIRHSMLVRPCGLQRIAVRQTPLRHSSWSWSWRTSCEPFYDRSLNLGHYLPKYNDSHVDFSYACAIPSR